MTCRIGRPVSRSGSTPARERSPAIATIDRNGHTWKLGWKPIVNATDSPSECPAAEMRFRSTSPPIGVSVLAARVWSITYLASPGNFVQSIWLAPPGMPLRIGNVGAATT